MTTQLLRYVTSSPHNVDVKGDIFKHTIYPLSPIVIDFYRLGVTEGGRRIPPPPIVEDQKNPGLNTLFFILAGP